MTEEEFKIWERVRDNEFIIEQVSLLEQECREAGIPIEDTRHYWYKSKKFSIFAKNRIRGYDEVKDEIVSEMNLHSPIYEPIPREPVQDPHLLVIDPSDPHIGKLAVLSETGEQYNIDIAVNKVKSGVKRLLQHSSGFNIDKILFIIGNDALHVDNAFSTTTSGTNQDTDGMWHEAFHAAKKMYLDLIETFLPIADVHVIYNPSNHDFTHGFFLADCLSSWFRNSDNITFDTSIRHRKYFKYGQNMIETDHGDGCKPKDTPMLMAHEESQMWAQCKHRYSYKHHIHHKVKLGSIVEMGVDGVGVNIEFLRSPSSADGWHDRNGYKSMQSVEGFIHSKENGRVASLSHNY